MTERQVTVLQTVPAIQTTLQTLPTATTTVASAQGPAGPQGPAGIPGNTALVYVAGANLSGHQMVVISDDGTVVYASASIRNHFARVLGMTIGASSIGTSATIQNSGVVDFLGWGWTADAPVYLGLNGSLTQTPPAAVFIQAIGTALSSSKLLLSLQPPILLS